MMRNPKVFVSSLLLYFVFILCIIFTKTSDNVKLAMFSFSTVYMLYDVFEALKTEVNDDSYLTFNLL